MNIEEVLNEAKTLGLELGGGFFAFWIATAHHRLFHWLARYLPRRLKGGTHG